MYTANLCINRYIHLPPELYLIIRNFLYYPHEYPYLERKMYNSTLSNLPKLSSYPFEDQMTWVKNSRLCKYSYILYHTKSEPLSYISIIEYVALRDKDQMKMTYWKDFFRRRYMWRHYLRNNNLARKINKRVYRIT